MSQASNATALHKQWCNSITTRCVDIICQMNPRVFSMENVLHARSHPVWQAAVSKLNARGYHTAQVQLDACRMGLGHSRRRLFVVGVRANGDDLIAVHHLQSFISRCKHMMRDGTVTSIADTCPELINKTLFSYPRRRENQCVFSTDRPHPCIRSMCLAPPSASLLQNNPVNAGPIEDAEHPSIDVIKALCGFPPSFELSGRRVFDAQCLGNCVVVPMGRFIADFARSLVEFAGPPTPSSTPGVSLVAKYAIPPVIWAHATRRRD